MNHDTTLKPSSHGNYKQRDKTIEKQLKLAYPLYEVMVDTIMGWGMLPSHVVKLMSLTKTRHGPVSDY